MPRGSRSAWAAGVAERLFDYCHGRRADQRKAVGVVVKRELAASTGRAASSVFTLT